MVQTLKRGSPSKVVGPIIVEAVIKHLAIQVIDVFLVCFFGVY